MYPSASGYLLLWHRWQCTGFGSKFLYVIVVDTYGFCLSSVFFFSGVVLLLSDFAATDGAVVVLFASGKDKAISTMFGGLFPRRVAVWQARRGARRPQYWGCRGSG